MTNTAPEFKDELKKNYRVQLTKEYFLRFPETFDKENNPVKFRFNNLPSFMTFDNNDKIISISPVEPKTDLGTFKIKGMITDTNK